MPLGELRKLGPVKNRVNKTRGSSSSPLLHTVATYPNSNVFLLRIFNFRSDFLVKLNEWHALISFRV